MATINQAVVFTKPVHHLDVDLDPGKLGRQTREFLEANGFAIIHRRTVSGPELSEREVIRKHYLMYSKASYGDFCITDEGRAGFSESFGKEWEAEVAAGRIAGNPQLMEAKGIDAHGLFELWDAADVRKVQAGLLMGWLDALDCYCINAFYPAMEANFYHPDTRIDYYVVEFDPARISWERFRKEVLGSTNAAKAAPGSFRGQLYARYPVDFPGRDNFVHGSAGPLESLVERVIHEPDFNMATNPAGAYLAVSGISLDAFKKWKARQSVADLGDLFDATEEKNTADIFRILDGVDW